jgi:glycosyltransferase involved in cell wall biosynthesis
MHILFVSWWWPYPANNGSKIRIYNLLRRLSARHQVTLLSFAKAEEATPEQLAHLQTFCARVEVVAKPTYHPTALKALAGYFSYWPRSLVDVYSREMERCVLQTARSSQVDVIIASQQQTMRYVDLLPGIPAILEEAEVTIFHDRMDEARGVARLRSQLTLAKLERALEKLMRRGVAVTTVSDAEQAYIKRIALGGSRVEVIPNGVDTVVHQPDPTASPQPFSLIYTGSVTYQPNHNAVAYFVRDVWPLIRQQFPQATFTVTGSFHNVDIRDLAAQPGVHFSGHIPSVAEALQKCCALVVTLRVGGGTRLKILEAMALGVPVISTSKGAEGLNLQDGEHLLIANTSEEIAEAVSRLFQDVELRHRLVIAARKLVEQEYDWQVIGGRLCDLVEQVALKRPIG